MAKTKQSHIVGNALPYAPLMYINDPTIDAAFVAGLTQLIPNTLHVDLTKLFEEGGVGPQLTDAARLRDTVVIFSERRQDQEEEEKKKTADLVRETAIRLGCNFVSVNVHLHEDANVTSWGTYHINICVKGSATEVRTTEIQTKTEQVYKWLFSVLPVKDTLHYISHEEMRVIDSDTCFRDYQYCPISQCRKVERDAKVQFVALIVDKPTIVCNSKLSWQVADKTGVANFYFEWRGPSCQPTWDWVLSLQPGQRKCLPRMPAVLVKEHLLTTIIKAPVRVPGTIIRITGRTVKRVGSGISRVGRSLQMGQRKKWVPEADVPAYMATHKARIVPGKEKVTIKIFNEKGDKAWTDKDSARSTLAGSEDIEKSKSDV